MESKSGAGDYLRHQLCLQSESIVKNTIDFLRISVYNAGITEDEYLSGEFSVLRNRNPANAAPGKSKIT